MSWSQILDDTFTRPDTSAGGAGTTTGAGNGWTDVAGGVWDIHSDALNGTTSSASGYSTNFLTRPSSENHQDIRMVAAAVVNTAASLECNLRYQSGSKDNYHLDLNFSNGTVGVYARVAGSYALLGSAVSVSFTNGHAVSVDYSVTGTNPATVSVTVTDTTASTVLANFTRTDSSATLQGSGGFAVANNANSGTPTLVVTRVTTYQATPSPLTLTAPAAYQVFQRSGTSGSVAVSGTNADTAAHDIEASFNGGAYATVASAVGAGQPFSGTLAGQAQGQGTLTVRFRDAPATTATVSYVGVGDVFGVWGQSNASGRGGNNQSYQHPTLKAGLFGNDYAWKQLADPTDDPTGQADVVSNDTSTGNANGSSAGAPAGSYWPLLATELMANLGVPVAFVPCALGATQISQWLPGGAGHADRTTLYGSANYRCQQAGGVRAVLWHQGENDAISGTTTASYTSQMQTLAAAVAADLGVKLVPCKFQNCTGIAGGNGAGSAQGNVLAAIAAEWASDANVSAGPDLSDLVSDDSYHLMTDAALRVAASRWWTALAKALYGLGSGGGAGGTGRGGGSVSLGV